MPNSKGAYQGETGLVSSENVPIDVLDAGTTARTAAGTSAAVHVGDSKTIDLMLKVTAAVGGTSPTLIPQVQWSEDSAFTHVYPEPAETGLASGSNMIKQYACKGDYFRLSYTFTGTPTSMTFRAAAKRRTL